MWHIDAQRQRHIVLSAGLYRLRRASHSSKGEGGASSFLQGESLTYLVKRIVAAAVVTRSDWAAELNHDLDEHRILVSDPPRSAL